MLAQTQKEQLLLKDANLRSQAKDLEKASTLVHDQARTLNAVKGQGAQFLASLQRERDEDRARVVQLQQDQANATKEWQKSLAALMDEVKASKEREAGWIARLESVTVRGLSCHGVFRH